MLGQGANYMVSNFQPHYRVVTSCCKEQALSKWRQLQGTGCRLPSSWYTSKMLAIAHQELIYRCAPSMDVAPRMTPVAGLNIPTAPVLAMPPLPIFVE
uniref:Uncharacterized protein n=1 Tax=Romanomermis culicivorax TaxID=13658 RepID=A0A915KGG8_ROMCU